MKRLIPILYLLLVVPVALYAQANVIYSQPFPEPNDGANRLMILKNGNTAYLHSADGKLHVRIYGKDGKTIADQNNVYSSVIEGKTRDVYTELVMEVNSNIVVLLVNKTGCGLGGYINCLKTMYRLVIDANTGKLIKGESLGALEKARDVGYDNEAMVFNDFYTAKDPVSDMYAVLFFNGYTEDKTDRVLLVVYNGDNEVVKKAVLSAPSVQDRFTHFAGMSMYNKDVFLGTHIFNPKKKGLDIPLYISALRNGASEFETKEIKIPPFSGKTVTTMVYNPGSNLLQLLTTCKTETRFRYNLAGGTFKNFYASIVSTIDPKTLEILSSAPLVSSMADEYAKTHLGEKKGFNGVMPSMYINKDNSITVIPEEQYEKTSSHMGFGGSYASTTTTYVDKIGLIVLDKNCKEVSGCVMRIRPEGGSTPGKAIDSYFGYQYINTAKANYIVMNDIPENFDLPETESAKGIRTISDNNTIVTKIAGGKIQKYYMFGDPGRKGATKFSNIGSATYDDATNTYATIVVNGDTKNAYIAWTTFE